MSELEKAAKFVRWTEEVARTAFDLVSLTDPIIEETPDDERLAFRAGAIAACGVFAGFLVDRGLLNIDDLLDQIKDNNEDI